MKLTIIILFFSINIFNSVNCYSQSKDKRVTYKNVSDTNRRLIQFSGAVVTADSLLPIRFANILIQGQNRGGSANYYGFFSFVAYTGDVLEFSSQGYKSAYYKIPDTLKLDHYSMFQTMQTDTFMLQVTVIYPWATIEALENAIVYADIPVTDYDRALINLKREELKELGMHFEMDGSMNYKNQMQGIIDKSYYNGQYAPISLFNPFAWAQFFKAWQEGKFKKKSGD